MRSVIVFAAFALGAAMVVPRYAAQIERSRPAPAMLAAHPADPPAGGSDSVVVPSDERGHFRVEGRVNGQRLAFLVDTGATLVALTADDAASLGIHPAEREFTALVKTANGAVRAAPVELDMVEIGDLKLTGVDAMVMPEEALGENLLGLSFLSRLRHFEYGNGKLVLEQ
jgi:aspartyl protease family protein